jgi:quercetin dioxygenase-like cupin family protein
MTNIRLRLAMAHHKPFHRTLSLDYGIVMKGKVTLTLENNVRVTLGVGDIVVQRGNIHGWVNETDEWARMYFVMLCE